MSAILRRFLSCLALLLACSAVAQQQLEIIPLRSQTVDRVLPTLLPLVEPGGTLIGANDQLFLRASAQNRAEIKRVLEAIDRPSRRLIIRVSHDRASEASSRGAEIGGRVDRVTTAADPAKANTALYYAYHGVTSTSRTDTEPSLSLRIAHDLRGGLELSAGVSRTVRSPDPRERYFGLKRMGGDWVGNPELDPPQMRAAARGLTGLPKWGLIPVIP